MSNNIKSRNFLRIGTLAAAELTSLVLALTPDSFKPANSQEPSRLTYEQVEAASPINYQEIIPNPANPQFPDAAYPSQTKFPIPPKEPLPPQTPKPDFYLGPDGTPHKYPTQTQSILDSAPQPTQQPTPALPRNIPLPPIPTEPSSQPVYQPAPAQNNVPLRDRYTEGQVHQFVSKLSLPESPWATACIGKTKNPNALERIFGKRQIYVIADCQSAHIQQQVGMGFVNEPHELRTLAKIVSDIYQPAYTNPKAFETLAKYASLDSSFVEGLEGTKEPTEYDRLAQFSFKYAGSLSTNFPGVIYYQTSEGHWHATGSAKAIKQLKQRTR